MGESQAHLALVDRAYSYIARRFPADRGFVTYVDGPNTSRSDKPPRIGGFVPDVVAANVPTTFYVIGEAKTLADLDNDHTRAQLTAFCRHLRVHGGVLVMAVPWTVTVIARRLVASAVTETNAAEIETVILGDVPPWP